MFDDWLWLVLLLITLKELQNYKQKLFLSSTKIGKNKTNILKLLFFTINLHFVTSNQISTQRELNLPLINSIYFIFLPLEMQKRLKQSKVYHTFSYFVRKEMTHKPLKVAAAKFLFSSGYLIGTICLAECFLLIW